MVAGAEQQVLQKMRLKTIIAVSVAVVLLLAGIALCAMGWAVGNPDLITTPRPPWAGTGMTEIQFLEHLRCEALPWWTAGIVAIASSLGVAGYVAWKRHRKKRKDLDNMSMYLTGASRAPEAGRPRCSVR